MTDTTNPPRRHNVAVVVLTTVEGAVDYADAARIAEKAVKEALGSHGTWNKQAPRLTVTVQAWFDEHLSWPVHVHGIEPLDQAQHGGRVFTMMAAPRVYDDSED